MTQRTRHEGWHVNGQIFFNLHDIHELVAACADDEREKERTFEARQRNQTMRELLTRVGASYFENQGEGSNAGSPAGASRE